MTRGTLILALIWLGMLCINTAPIGASVVLNDNFATFADGQLNGQFGWHLTEASTANPLQVVNGRVVVPYLGAVPADDADSGKDFSAPFTTPPSGTLSVFLGATVTVNQVDSLVPASNSRALFMRSSDDFPHCRMLMRAGTAPGTFQFGTRLTGEATSTPGWGGDLLLGQEYLYVLRVDLTAGNENDAAHLYIDPTGTVPPATPYASSVSGTGVHDPIGLKAVEISQFASTVGPQNGMRIGRITISDSFADVVPEPGLGGWLLIGAAALLRRARRATARVHRDPSSESWIGHGRRPPSLEDVLATFKFVGNSNDSRRLLLCGLLVLTALGTATTPASAALIINGSFEEGDFGGAPSFRRLPPASTELTGWAIGGVGVDWHNAVEMNFPHSGDKVLDLHLDGGAGGHGTLSQSFATMPGSLYELSFFLAGPGINFGFPNPRSVIVDIAGVQQTFSTPASPNTDIQWGGHQLLFTAVDTTTTLTFSSPHDGQGFWGPVLDDVSVTAVPEPTSAIFFLAGATALALTRRPRKLRILADLAPFQKQ